MSSQMVDVDSSVDLHWTSNILPCVYVFPPEEDEEKIIRIFPHINADPFSSHASGGDDVFYEFFDPADDDEKVEQCRALCKDAGPPSPSGSAATSSRAVKKAQPYKTLKPRRGNTQPLYIQTERDQVVASEEVSIPPPSRRSSVFEDRGTAAEPASPKNLNFTSLVESPSSSPVESSDKRSFSFKERVVTAFGSFRKPNLRGRRKDELVSEKNPSKTVIACEASPRHESKKKKNRRSLLAFLNPPSKSEDVLTGTSEDQVHGSTGLSVGGKGKEKTNLTFLGIRRSTSLSRPSVDDSERVAPLSRRRSITQVFNQKFSSKVNPLNESKHSTSTQNSDPPLSSRTSHASSSSKSARTGRELAKTSFERAQLLSTRSESETGEDEPKSPLISSSPADVTVPVDDSSVLSSSDCRPIPLETTDFSNRFSLHIDNSTDSPIMELAVKLNSLEFDYLDSGIYADINDDE